MKLKTIALAALMATSISSHAGLTTYTPWDVAFAGNGLAGVQFNVQSAAGVTVALGAHAYKNGVFLANDGVSTFQAANDVYLPDGKGRANWSFDFAYDLGTNCAGCMVTLKVDTDPTSGEVMRDLFVTNVLGNAYADSWNMEMNFADPAGFAQLPGNGFVASPYDFNPYAASSTAFRLEVRSANGALITATDITVNVPEPGSLALAGLALAGLAMVRRRKA